MSFLINDPSARTQTRNLLRLEAKHRYHAVIAAEAEAAEAEAAEAEQIADCTKLQMALGNSEYLQKAPDSSR